MYETLMGFILSLNDIISFALINKLYCSLLIL